MNNNINKFDVTNLKLERKQRVKLLKVLAILASALAFTLSVYLAIHFGLTASSNYLEGYTDGRKSMYSEVELSLEQVKETLNQIVLPPSTKEYEEYDWEDGRWD